ncbi:MAG: hypothetical protein JO205_10210 [Pseudolabrys sp.]|nr:hypothetical protein [Pseudolabrys sp.]MBV9261732.1 hypothetical protein [Pseudolabrys sp.]
MRLVNILVIGVLILAASFVYKIKFDSTLQAERISRLRGELRRERDAIATLRAEWARLDNPARLQALTQRYLPLRPADPHQFDDFLHLPERPQPVVPPPDEPIGATAPPSEATGSIDGQVKR